MSKSNPDISPQQEAPMFGIGAVTRITGISETTLRVWERRYHFPQTFRTSGGHRLYSQDEVLHLQWVKMHVDEGIRTRQAILALSQTERDLGVVGALHEPLRMNRESDASLMTVRDALLEALLTYDSSQISSILQESTARHSLSDLVLDVIAPTLSEIGEGWCRGEVEVATEHFATNILRQQLQLWMQASPIPYVVNSVVLACAPEELHEGSLLMLGVLLRQLRWPVIYLGQSLLLSDLRSLVERVHPALIVFVAMSEATALGLVNWPNWLVDTREGRAPIVGYGGRAFTENPTLADYVPGVLLGSTLTEGSQRIHRVMLNLNALRNRAS